MQHQISEKLKGLRASKNRDDVISLLQQGASPMAVEDIYESIKKLNNKISLSTVYRIIEKLVNLNIVHKVTTLDDNRALYEIVKDSHNHHHYMICVKCKKMIPIDDCPVKELEKSIEDKTGFSITGHKFELYGECKNCAQKHS